MSFGKFLLKHADDLLSIGKVLGSVVHAIPLDRQDKENLNDTINGLEKAASNIALSADAAGNIDNIDFALLKNAVREVVEDMLPELLGAIAEKVFELSKDDASKTVNKTTTKRK